MQSDTELNLNPEGRSDNSCYGLQARCQQPCSSCGNWAQCALFEMHCCADLEDRHMCATCARGGFVDYLRSQSSHGPARCCPPLAWNGCSDQQKLNHLLAFGIPWELAFSITHGRPRTTHSDLAVPAASARPGPELPMEGGLSRKSQPTEDDIHEHEVSFMQGDLSLANIKTSIRYGRAGSVTLEDTEMEAWSARLCKGKLPGQKVSSASAAAVRRDIAAAVKVLNWEDLILQLYSMRRRGATEYFRRIDSMSTTAYRGRCMSFTRASSMLMLHCGMRLL